MSSRAVRNRPQSIDLKSDGKYPTAMINLALFDSTLENTDLVRFTFSKSVDLNFLLTARRTPPPVVHLLALVAQNVFFTFFSR